MNDLVAEGLLLFSAFAAIVVRILIIVKERRKPKAVDTKRAKNHAKKSRTGSTASSMGSWK
jgi:hypothetical protein